MKITYLVIALGLLCTFAYAQAKLEDGVMKESDENTAPVETVEEELVENDDENPEEENDDENPEEESDDETDPEHDLEQSDDRELTENNNDMKVGPSVEKRSTLWGFRLTRRTRRRSRPSGPSRRNWNRSRRLWAEYGKTP
ncbi:probable ATP-dependent RNA helicase ddx56 isoform X4 [Xenia sp. Carnegie-2017]|uniref:probable ATP-dependent RNA helicase ddx56 isoform X4 n=1 Tax=Xenia sp. Carnegie-2017 TaxID=2897299 RepID=UPI001F03E792|nr:probable ATP-dependent RNA helicase ddx56 isoform X4 [Xenia sp. Carnegie-2017]